METKNIPNWNDYELFIEETRNSLSLIKDSSGSYVSDLFFRGQNNSDWKLETTLERFNSIETELGEYCRLLLRVKPAIECFTEKEFEFAYENELEEDLHTKDGRGFRIGQFEFMSHLRHNGFPSPLLDWTLSPYVALFFAFNNANENDSVAVFIYIEHCGSGKGGVVGAPEIINRGRYIKTHKRHFLQQSEYTYCVIKKGNDWFYCSHEEAFNQARTSQDRLIKVIIPGSEKQNILKKLDEMNINAYSLFGTEDCLMQTLAFREKR
jgi:hypothetical protein